MLLPLVVEALPTLVHVSLSLFFGGLAVFLWHVDLTIFKSVLSWIGVCAVLYGCFTFMPIIRHDSPYDTPLSSPTWYVVTGIRYVVFRFLRWLRGFQLGGGTHNRFSNLEHRYRKLLVRGIAKAIKQTALDLPSQIDTRAFMWTLGRLDEDQELERFFSGLPGFRSSKVVGDPLPLLNDNQRKRLSEAWIALFNHTFSSDSLPESVKNWRELQTTKFGHTARGWGNSENKGISSVTQAIVTSIIAKVQQHDDPWFSLASNELGVAESVLRYYAAHGDSLSLAILLHVTRRHFSLFKEQFWPFVSFGKVLEAASKFSVRDTLPELQHEFCTLWNEIVLKAQNDNDWGMAYDILGKIRNVYITLHQDTNSAPTLFSLSTGDHDAVLNFPSSYPVCSVPGHTHDNSASPTFSRTVLPNDSAPVTPSFPTPHVPSSSVPAPVHITETVRLRDNEKSVPGPVLSAHQSATDNFSIPVTSLDLVTAHVIQGGKETPTKTMPLSTTELSAPASQPISTPSSGDVAIQKVTDRSTPSSVSASASPTPVIAGVLPIGPSLSSDSP